jgi:aminobenzoyl-glutamate utilization protein A
MENLPEIRKKFHQWPETCWTEFWTTAEICKSLESLGYDLMIGNEIIQENLRASVPDEEVIEKAYQDAINHGADQKYLEKMRSGLTGVIGILDTGKPGPTIAFRADIDALPITESKRKKHVPHKEGWRSQIEGKSHACGHDVHLTIGLGIANYIAKNKNMLRGRFVMIFSPAEEGGRGCLSISKLPIISEINYILAYHDATMPCGGNHFLMPRIFFRSLATYEIEYTAGKQSMLPEIVLSSEGETEVQQPKSVSEFLNNIVKGFNSTPITLDNAIMAACSAILNLKAIPKKPNGHSFILISNLYTEMDKNNPGIGFDPVRFDITVSADDDDICNYLKEKAFQILESTAKIYNVKLNLKKIEKACYPAWPGNSPELVNLAIEMWKEMGRDENIINPRFGEMGTDDVIFIMKEIIQNGGKAAYLVLVSDDSKGAMKNIHTDRFNVRNDFFEVGVNLIVRMIEKILKGSKN